MIFRQSLAALLPLFLSGPVFSAISKKTIAPKQGIIVLVNDNNSHVSIDVIDGERNGVKPHGVYELAPGRHTIRTRLFYRKGNTEWSSQNFLDHSFNVEGGVVLNLVCIEGSTGKDAGTWRVRIEDASNGRDVIDQNPSPVNDAKEHDLQLERNFAEVRGKAEQGELESQFALGLLYERGEGTSPDTAESIRWYLKAAERGHATAQFMLGLSYDIGQGVPKDLAKAFVWFSLAAANGDPSSPYFRDEDEKLLSPDELLKAKADLAVLEAEIRARTATP